MIELTWWELRAKVKEIVDKFYLWELTIENAILQSEPYIYEINKRWKEIAKEYKKKFYPITFTGIAR